MQRPLGPSDLYCPMWRKRCDKVCHQCPLWQPLDLTVNGQSVTDWRCALVWPVTLGTVANARMDGLGAAMEQMRNRFDDLRASFVEVIRRVATARGEVQRLEGPNG